MKKISLYKILPVLPLLLLLSGCSDSFLDKEEDDKKSEKEVYTRYEEVNKNVTEAYYLAKAANRPLVWLEHFSSAAITDECESTNVEGNIGNLYNQGAWNPNSNFPGNVRQFWNSIYESIRHINVTLAGIKNTIRPITQ